MHGNISDNRDGTSKTALICLQSDGKQKLSESIDNNLYNLFGDLGIVLIALPLPTFPNIGDLLSLKIPTKPQRNQQISGTSQGPIANQPHLHGALNSPRFFGFNQRSAI